MKVMEKKLHVTMTYRTGLLIGLAPVLLGVVAVSANPGSGVSNVVPSPRQREAALVAARKSWVSDPWTADDKPYVAARTSADKRLQGQLTLSQVDQIISAYQKSANADWRNSVKQFAWAYAALQASRLYEIWMYKYIPPALENLRQVPSPKSYEFTRLRYMLATLMGEPGSDLKPLARRLLHRNPRDSDVIYYYLGSLIMRRPEEKREAVKWLAIYTKDFAKKPSTAYMAGRMYYKMWLSGGKKKSDGAKATSYFRQYLAMIKTDKTHHVDPWGTRWVQSKIRRIEKESK